MAIFNFSAPFLVDLLHRIVVTGVRWQTGISNKRIMDDHTDLFTTLVMYT